MHLALAAPDKEEVRAVWTYRWTELQALGVPVRLGVVATEDMIRQFAPDLGVGATGSKPRPLALDLSGLAADIRRAHAWDVLAEPAAIANGAAVAVIGGGMVGIEVADLLALRGCRITIIEALASIAPAMARNNPTDILQRLQQAGVRILTRANLRSARGRDLVLETPEGTLNVAAGDAVIVAIGPKSERGGVPLLERAGADYALVGDAQEPGDFLGAIRDGWLVGLSLETRFKQSASGGRVEVNPR